MTAGGKREGAGRKPREAPLVALTMKLDPDLLDAWNARKAELGISGPALIAKLLRWAAVGEKPRARSGARSHTEKLRDAAP